ncbi:MAG: hypothetical protein AB7I96_02310 [Candidatus Dadabacteria bacterium]
MRKVAKVHSVKASLQVIELSKAGSSLNLEISANKKKLVELEIGRGALYWTGKNRQKSKRIDWTSFAEMMDGLAYGKSNLVRESRKV